MKVVFLHGLESGPNGHKPTRLRTAHAVTAPALPTARALAFLKTHLAALPVEIAAEPLAVAADAVLSVRPDVVVGSSFGGGLAAKLAADGVWQGPLVLLAPAAAKLFEVVMLPKRAGRVLVLHGRGDEVVPSSDSVRLAETSAADVVLWLVDDDHRLKASVDAGLMDQAIAFAAQGT